MIPITKTTVVFIHSQTSLFVSHILSSIAFRSFDMSVIVLDKNAQTCVIKDIVTSLIQRKFVEKATHKATTHAITSQIGQVSTAIAHHIAGNNGSITHKTATSPASHNARSAIVDVNFGFSLANLVTASIAGCIVCITLCKIGINAFHNWTCKSEKDFHNLAFAPAYSFVIFIASQTWNFVSSKIPWYSASLFCSIVRLFVVTHIFFAYSSRIFATFFVTPALSTSMEFSFFKPSVADITASQRL